MNLKYVILGTALLLPMTLVSCDDSKVPSEPVDDASADGLDAPNFTTVGFGSKWHDPHIKGVEIRVFSGTEDTENGESGDCDPSPAFRLCDYGGEAKRFKSKDGAEVNTLGFDKPDGSYGGIYGKRNLIAGKLVGRVKELDFSYAGGGPSGGSPRFSIPIDECKYPEPDLSTNVTPGCTTDGHWDQFIFADVTESSGCNDGDGNVGVLNGEDDETCTWYLGGVIPFANWAAFVAAHPDWRIATDTPPFTVVDQPGHYLLFKWDVR